MDLSRLLLSYEFWERRSLAGKTALTVDLSRLLLRETLDAFVLRLFNFEEKSEQWICNFEQQDGDLDPEQECAALGSGTSTTCFGVFPDNPEICPEYGTWSLRGLGGFESVRTQRMCV